MKSTLQLWALQDAIEKCASMPQGATASQQEAARQYKDQMHQLNTTAYDDAEKYYDKTRAEEYNSRQFPGRESQNFLNWTMRNYDKYGLPDAPTLGYKPNAQEMQEYGDSRGNYKAFMAHMNPAYIEAAVKRNSGLNYAPTDQEFASGMSANYPLNMIYLGDRKNIEHYGGIAHEFGHLRDTAHLEQKLGIPWGQQQAGYQNNPLTRYDLERRAGQKGGEALAQASAEGAQYDPLYKQAPISQADARRFASEGLPSYAPEKQMEELSTRMAPQLPQEMQRSINLKRQQRDSRQLMDESYYRHQYMPHAQQLKKQVQDVVAAETNKYDMNRAQEQMTGMRNV